MTEKELESSHLTQAPSGGGIPLGHTWPKVFSSLSTKAHDRTHDLIKQLLLCSVKFPHATDLHRW